MIEEILRDENTTPSSIAKKQTVKQFLLEATSYLEMLGLGAMPLKPRLELFRKGILAPENYPRCKCGNPVIWNKSNGELSKFCSNRCNVQSRSIAPPDKLQLEDLRIRQRLSKDEIADFFGVSAPTVDRWIKHHKIPEFRYNESSSQTIAYLRDKEWLVKRHQIDRKTLEEIAKEIGSSKSTVSVVMKDHEIETNEPNSYNRRSVFSKQSQEVADYIQALGAEVEIGNREILGGREIDILIKSKGLAIEFNGLYSHVHRPWLKSEAQQKGRYYHLQKTLGCQEKGYTLMHIFSDQWEQKRPIVESMISNKLGYSKKIFARQCKIIKVETKQAKAFFENNHIQGWASSRYHYGLEKDGILVALIGFTPARFNRQHQFELVRFANLLYTTVVGGFSRLLKHFVDLHGGNIITYADRCYSNGLVYEKNGFRLIGVNGPGYHYVDPTFTKRIHRAAFTKKHIAKEGDSRPEHLIMLERGFHRIWNCGTLVYSMKNHTKSLRILPLESMT